MDIPAGILASPEKPFRICAIFQIADPTPSNIKELTEIVSSTMALSQAEDGVLQYEVTWEAKTNTFYFFEQYASLAVLNKHAAGKGFIDLSKVFGRFSRQEIHFLESL
ncbi:hypothetical protein BDY24DRAFT_402496 [Mrakia frigida]|uniref:putative quinol monooxygenase n=1 Tax=Mrakia frigida TaxID=29902 RepID=UPI003FCBF00B